MKHILASLIILLGLSSNAASQDDCVTLEDLLRTNTAWHDTLTVKGDAAILLNEKILRASGIDKEYVRVTSNIIIFKSDYFPQNLIVQWFDDGGCALSHTRGPKEDIMKFLLEVEGINA